MLVNASFEKLDGWNLYHLGEQVAVNVEDRATGALATLDETALRFYSEWHVFQSGVYQSVRVTSGTPLKLSAWSFFFASSRSASLSDNQVRELYTRFRVGIDPTGGFEPRSDKITWNAVGGDMLWKQAEVSTMAQAEEITVFVEAQVGKDWPMQIMAAHFDKCVLVVGDEQNPVETSGEAAYYLDVPAFRIAVRRGVPVG